MQKHTYKTRKRKKNIRGKTKFYILPVGCLDSDFEKKLTGKKYCNYRGHFGKEEKYLTCIMVVRKINLNLYTIVNKP